MKSISFSFNNLCFVIHPFKFSGVNGVIAVIEDSVKEHPAKYDEYSWKNSLITIEAGYYRLSHRANKMGFRKDIYNSP